MSTGFGRRSAVVGQAASFLPGGAYGDVGE
jgi:hypothetical protein